MPSALTYAFFASAFILCVFSFSGDYDQVDALKSSRRKKVKNGESLLPKISQIGPGLRCEPYTRFRVGCNICYCSFYRKWACTKRECESYESLHLKAKVCGPEFLKWLEEKNNKTKNENTTDPNTLRSYCGDVPNPILFKIPEVPEGPCEPGALYRQECDRCFCNENSTAVCVSRMCNDLVNFRDTIRPADTRPPFSPEEFAALPVLPSAAAECRPGGAYRVECNPCLCLANGNLLCEKKLCHDPFYNQNYEYMQTVQGKPCNESIQEKCVDCLCENGALSCNVIQSCQPLLRRGVESSSPVYSGIDPKKDSCRPGEVYVQDCNKCVCQKDGSLHCTSRICLNHSQTVELQDRIKVLEESGQL